MAVTQNTYTGDGTTVLFSFTFPYLETTDIKVSVNGTNTTAYTLANATTIQFNTAPVNGAAIRIYRQTDDTALAAAFYPGSAIRSADLNDNFTQNLYVTQESNRDATQAISTANAATTTANSAVATANGAVATANTASSNAAAAVATANTASSNASAAVSTANTASSNATTAVNTANAATATANSAAADAATAISTANSAVSTANSAVSTANSAVTTAGNAVTSANSAVSTATTASTNASNAVTTANAANSTAANALTTAGNAVTTANSAVSTANAADTKADQAINAVANALLFDIVANVAAIPASPSNNDAVEITNSTGIESFTPLSGLPAGFVGDAGLSVRLLYQSAGSTWTWLQYFPNDPDNRYAGPNTDAGTAAAPSIAFGPTDPNTGIFSPGADEFGIATGGVGRFFIDAAGNVVVATALSVNGEDVVVDNDSRLTDSRTPTDGSVTNAKVDANAAIAGTKISPDFGAQNVTTTGTSTAASFIPSSSTVPTNGVYLPAANSVAISTNSTGRLFVDSSGRVGVGTSSATDLLSVGTLGSSTDATITLGSSTTSSGQIYFGDGTGASRYRGYVQYNHSSDSLILGSAGSDRVTVDSSGRLGIGTSSVDRLFIASDSADNNLPCAVITKTVTGGANSGLQVHTAGTDAGAGAYCFRVTAGNTYGSPTSEYLRVTAAGRVGIGSNSPLSTLECRGQFSISNNATSYWVLDRDDSDGRLKLLDSSTSSNERLAVDASGRLLVGTSSAGGTELIQIQGTSGGSNLPGGIALRRSSLGNGDDIGYVNFTNASGNIHAGIKAFADGTPGASDYPGALVFSTTSDNASSPSERLRIASTGALGLSGANYGSAGQVLTSQGSGAAPQWATPAGGAWTYISTINAAGASTVDFTGIDSTYNLYMIVGNYFIPSTTARIWMRTSSNGGSSYDSGASDYSYLFVRLLFTYSAQGNGAQNYSEAELSPAVNLSSTTANGGLSFQIFIHNPSNTSTHKFIQYSSSAYSGSDSLYAMSNGYMIRKSTSAVNAFRIRTDAGTFSSGTARLYGLKSS